MKGTLSHTSYMTCMYRMQHTGIHSGN